MEIAGTHKYNNRSSTKRVNHVTTFKNAPKMFQEDTKEKIKFTEAQTTLIAQTLNKKQTKTDPLIS